MSGIHPYLSESTNNNNIEYYLNFLNDILTSAPKKVAPGVNTMPTKEDIWSVGTLRGGDLHTLIPIQRGL